MILSIFILTALGFDHTLTVVRRICLCKYLSRGLFEIKLNCYIPIDISIPRIHVSSRVPSTRNVEKDGEATEPLD